VAVDITAINGAPVAGHQGPGSIADITVRKLLMLEGASRPQRILSLMSYPGVAEALATQSARGHIRVAFTPPSRGGRAAGLSSSVLTPAGWIKLIARLGEIPDPKVASGPSPAAIPTAPTPSSSSGKEGNGHG
jgi:hypothetical protein